MFEPITVVIPTYNRASLLPRCLDGLLAQARPADRIIAVVRPTDQATRDALEAFANVEVVDVHEPGFIPALNAGAAAVTEGIIVFSDDDAVARPDWLANIEAHYLRDASLTGVGGRDVIHGEEVPPEDRKTRVGVTSKLGRTPGNHHLGAGPPREVEVLKGVNASYRRAHLPSVPFDERLQGSGGHHNEIGLGNWLIARGHRLVYDPDILVDHYPAPRTDGWRTGGVSVGQHQAFNEQLGYVERSLFVRSTVLIWGLLIGTPNAPGIVRCLLKMGEYTELKQRVIGNARSRIAGAHMPQRTVAR